MRMVVALPLVFSCLLSWILADVSAEVVITRLGGVARLNCSTTSGGSVEWKRRLPKQFSYIYVPPRLHKPYDTGGRHNVSLDNQTGACDLVITNVTEGDAGKYICTETIGRRESHVELVVLLDHNPTCGTSLTNVLIDNDCGIDPDNIEFNCSIAYRGNVAPEMQLQMSSIGVLNSVNVRNWPQSTTRYASVVWASKASWQMRDGRFRCEVRNTMADIHPTCSSTRVSVIYFYKSNRSLEISPGKDNQAHHFVTCAANTSEQCSYSWQGTHSNSSKSSDVLGPTIDLKSVDVEISSMRCHAECRLRNNVCVSKPMFIKFLSDGGHHLFLEIKIPLIIVNIFLILLVLLHFKRFKQQAKNNEKKNNEKKNNEKKNNEKKNNEKEDSTSQTDETEIQTLTAANECQVRLRSYSHENNSSQAYGYIEVNREKFLQGDITNNGLTGTSYRGVNIMEFDISTQRAYNWKWFDTCEWQPSFYHNNPKCHGNTSEFIEYFTNQVSVGTVLLGITMDDPMDKLSPAFAMLTEAGIDVSDLKHRAMFAFVMQKGFPEKTILLKRDPQPEAITLSVTIINENITENGTQNVVFCREK